MQTIDDPANLRTWKPLEWLALLLFFAVMIVTAIYQRRIDIKHCPPHGHYARAEGGQRYCVSGPEKP